MASGAAFLAVGLPYCQIPDAKASLPGDLIGPGIVAVAAAAFVLRVSRAAAFVPATLAAAGAVPAAVLVRVAVEVVRDPTSHSLWPFEAMIALGVGGVCALAGALAGSVVAWARRDGSAAADPAS